MRRIATIAITIGKWLIPLIIIVGGALFVALWVHTPSRDDFREMAHHRPYQTRILDREGRLLGAIPRQDSADGSAHSDTVLAAPYVALDRLPRCFPRFLKAQEGFNDKGFSAYRTLVAFSKWWLFGSNQGGSTVTQQLYRELTGHTQDTALRKLTEIVASTKMSFSYTETEVLELYANNVSFGFGRPGIEAAALRLFSKHASELNCREVNALLALLPAPSRSLAENADAYARGYKARLRETLDDGVISTSEYEELSQPPSFNRREPQPPAHGLFVQAVQQRLRSMIEDQGWRLTDGLVVQTTLRRPLNQKAGRLLEEYQSTHTGTPSFVLLNRWNEIVAYTRGQTWPGAALDLIQSPNTMPASRIKVIVYLLYVQHLMTEGMDPSSILEANVPTVYQVSEDFTVDDDEPQSEVSLRYAVVNSLNAPVYWILNEELSPERLRRFARRFGVDIPAIPAGGTGSTSVSELELVTAYSVLVRHGNYTRSSLIQEVRTRSGEVIYSRDEASEPMNGRLLVSEAAVDLIRQLLREVVYEGTAYRLREKHKFEWLDVGVKTGTSPRESKYKFFGATGVAEQFTFSLLVQGRGVTGSKGGRGSGGRTAVPLAADVLSTVNPTLKLETAGNKIVSNSQ